MFRRLIQVKPKQSLNSVIILVCGIDANAWNWLENHLHTESASDIVSGCTKSRELYQQTVKDY